MNDNNREIISLIYNTDQYYGFFRACSEVRNDRNRSSSLGRLGYYLNGSFVDSDEARMEFLTNLMSCPISRSVSIDARYLDDSEVLEILRNSSELREVRIIDDGYVITNDVLSRFSDNVVVVCDYASEDINPQYANRIYLQNGIFKKETNYVEDDLVSAYFIDHNLSDDELDRLVEIVNSDNSAEYSQISFRVYNPAEYKDFVTKLHERGLRDDIRINFLGNPLYDRSEAYAGLDEISNNIINVTYDTCSDMINFYTQEPFTVSNMHHSELEGGGKTSFDSYYSLLNILESQEAHIREQGYSPYEAAIYVYRFLQQNYAYDPNYISTDSIDALTNRQLDRVANSQTLVCEGYATLYSALLRRCGIPMFRYSTDRHVRNIGRIVDPKYGVDMIGVVDSTFDGSSILGDGSFSENRNFQYFMVSPKFSVSYDPYITIPTSLVFDYSVYGNEYLSFISRDPYESLIDFNYNPDGYAATMLDRMGIQIPQPFIYSEYRDLLANLSRTSIFNEIDANVFSRAYEYVLRKENPLMSDQVIEEYQLTASSSILDRISYIANNPLPYQIYVNGDNFSENGYYIPVVYYNGADNSLDISNFNKPTNEEVSIESQGELEVDRVVNPVEEEIEILDIDSDNDLSVDEVNLNSETINELEDEYIIPEEYVAGTNIRKPRYRGIYETDDQYVSYLENYYSTYFPDAVAINVEIGNNVTYHLTRDEIIQDLPIYSRQESRYTGIMTDAEIQESRNIIR